ncbi:endonuclease III, partial [Candidatus Gracilibacteria bacterium]|nr:endonuclease III [Candidatus Gracilibacteria bacterium]
AKVILSTLYNLSYVGVDTHVHRVLNRIGIVKTKSPKITDSIIEKVFTAQQKKKMHHSLVLFGRYNCTARKPKCDNCAVGDWCNFKHY